MLNETKLKILELLKQPITVKELKERSGLKMSNLSLHLTDLYRLGFVMEVGKQGKSRVIQMNQFNVNNYLNKEEDKLQELKENLTKVL